jgi:hypothetical protein
MKLSNFVSSETLRAVKVAAPFVALAALAALVAVFAWRTWFRKERFSKFSSRIWSGDQGKYVCPRGWKETKKGKKTPGGTYVGTWEPNTDRFCEKNKYSAFSDMVWDDKKGSVCPKGYVRNEKEDSKSDRACKRKEGDKFFEGGKNEKASTADEGCTDPEFPAIGKRPDREGQCCRAKYSRVCAGGGGGSAPSGGKKGDWASCTGGDECQSGTCDGSKKVCVPKSSAPAPSTPAPAPAPAVEEWGCNTDGTKDDRVGRNSNGCQNFSIDKRFPETRQWEGKAFPRCKCAEGVNERGNCKGKGKCAEPKVWET